jgi:ABC-type Fe3+ transport system permease subunit
MKNRTAAIIITILVILCCGCPGLTSLCWGLLSFVDIANSNWDITGIGDQNGLLASIFGGVCGGVFLIALVVLIAYFLLRKKKVDTTSVEPLPPTSADEPLPPSNPDEPLPPTI